MRFVAAIAGIAIALPALIFFWIGAQTFIRQSEKTLAIVLVAETCALLLLSLALPFVPSVQRLQAVLLALAVASIAAILAAYRR